MKTIKMLKSFVKREIPVAVEIWRYIKNREIILNYFKTDYTKNALLSYITCPFKKGVICRHTNSFEAMSHARILNELGYNVDIINYDFQGRINFLKYNILVGFGNVFSRYFESALTHYIKTIYYGTGMHVCHHNHATLKRLRDVYIKKGIWLGKSTRYIEKARTHQTYLVDAMIVLGNEVCSNSYRRFYNGPIFNIPAPFFKTVDGRKFVENTKKSFLWFGSSGLIHKGLDLVLDFFASQPNLKLHICGLIESEPEFEKVYYDELYKTPNIITHGFVNINSVEFERILEDCSFVIFPSCSEGGSPSVITVIGNGALIPIITKETSISTGHEIWIEDYTCEAIEKSVRKALELTDDEIIELRRKNMEYVLNNHTLENYYKRLKQAYVKILKNEM